MKKSYLFMSVCASLVFFLNASVWEGAAAAASGGELPETGFYIATNSFPANTVVDVTNLDNGKTVRAVASSGLDTPGLLALLSRDAANAISLQSRSLGRISISQPADPAAFSLRPEGAISSGDPDFDPAAFAALNSFNPSLLQPAVNGGTESSLNGRIEGGELIVDLENNTEINAQRVPLVIHDEGIVPETGPRFSELVFVPSETRPPESGPEPDPSQIIPGIALSSQASYQDYQNTDYIDPSLFIDPIGEINPEDHYPIALEIPLPEEIIIPAENLLNDNTLSYGETFSSGWQSFEEFTSNREATEPFSPVYSTSIFSVPFITSLAKGQYYLQIGAYSKEDTVKAELSKFDDSLPMAIMNAGTQDKPIYRILIGPVNLGESSALLQRFKNNYKDAFVRQGI